MKPAKKRGRPSLPRCLSCGEKMKGTLPRMGSYCPVCIKRATLPEGAGALEFVWFGIEFLLVRNANASKRKNLMAEDQDAD